MNNKHKNLSIFIPHLGCPNQCSFCDQRSISGAACAPTPEQVYDICEEFLKDGENTEIAFFGGSFTAIDRDYMIALLRTAKSFIDKKRAFGVRISTRPDCIDEEILDILKFYGVTSIELGAQSMQDDVLKLNLRGHTVKDVENASKLIKQKGFSLGLQMMTGLYGQKDYMLCAQDTAKQFALLQPDTVRVYPTITLKNTLLEEKYLKGEYIPPSLQQTVDICAWLLSFFEENNIKVIKMGLHADVNMESKMIAGPFHPAFKELCISKMYLDKIKGKLTNDTPQNIIIYVNSKELSAGKVRKTPIQNSLFQWDLMRNLNH